MVLRFNKRKVYLSVFLFMFIFMPPIFPYINILYILDVFAVIAIVTKYKSEYLLICTNKTISWFKNTFFIFSVVTIMHNILDWTIGEQLEVNEYIVNIYRIVGVEVLIIACSVYVVCYCLKNNLDFKQLCSCFMYAGLVQSIFAVIMVISPSAKTFFNNLFVMHTYGSIENSGIKSWIFNERLYGFANVLYDGFGYGTGIIAGIAIWLMLEEKKINIKYVLYVLVLIIVPVLNSITGFFIALLAVILKGGQIIKNKGIKFNSLIYCVLLIASAAGGLLILNNRATAAINRLFSNIMAILGKNDQITSYSNLMRPSYWILPTGIIDKFIGTGHTIYTTTQFGHSDVGYINMIWMVGIIGCIWLYSIFIIPIYTEYRKSETDLKKSILLFLIIAFLFFELKGIGVAINTGMPIIITLMYMAALEEEGK